MTEAQEYAVFEAFSDCEYDLERSVAKATEAIAELDPEWAKEWSEKVQKLLADYWNRAMDFKMAQTT